MTEEKHKIDDEVNPHGLADHKALRKMGTERLKELLDQTYEMRKDRLNPVPRQALPSIIILMNGSPSSRKNSIVAKTNFSKNFHILPPLNLPTKHPVRLWKRDFFGSSPPLFTSLNPRIFPPLSEIIQSF